MKKTCKAMLLAILGLMDVAIVQAQYNTVYPPGDLIVGFTLGSGTDEMYDLGKESSLTNGKNWNLSSLLTSYGNLSGVSWGVIGNSTNTGTARYAYTTTIVGVAPGAVQGTTAFGNLNNCAKALYQNFATAGTGQSATAAYNSDISWNTETLDGALFTDYVNTYENPNVQGVTSCAFSQMLYDGSNPTLLGQFTLAANGVLTYNTNSSTLTAPAAGFTGTPLAGSAPLKVVFTDASTGSITNWLWSFGDGHTLTNNTSSSVTNTYAAAGSYTVALTVTGAGGANTQTRASYVVVSSTGTPKINTVALSSGKFMLNGTGGSSGAQYRIFSTTNLALPFASWTPVATNSFLGDGSFAYTNSPATQTRAFFRLVSP